MAPEGLLLIVNAGLVALAYGVIYPRFDAQEIGRMMRTDLVLTGVSLGLAALFFAGAGHRFNMVLFETNWAVFAFLTFLLIETPVFLAYCKARGISQWEFDRFTGPGRDEDRPTSDD